MVSRDTAVHVRAVLLALLFLFLLTPFTAGPETGPEWVAVLLVFYGLALGGAHLYLALHGEDGIVPVEARWRYVATLVVLLLAGAAISFGGERTVATVDLGTVGLVVIVGTVIVYVFAESVAGYRGTRSE